MRAGNFAPKIFRGFETAQAIVFANSGIPFRFVSELHVAGVVQRFACGRRDRGWLRLETTHKTRFAFLAWS